MLLQIQSAILDFDVFLKFTLHLMKCCYKYKYNLLIKAKNMNFLISLVAKNDCHENVKVYEHKRLELTFSC